MDAEEKQLDKDQSNAGDGEGEEEVQPEVTITVTPLTEDVAPLGDAPTEDVHPTGDTSTVDPHPSSSTPTENIHVTSEASTGNLHPTGDLSTEDAHPTGDVYTEDVHPTDDLSTEDVHPTGDMSTEDVHPTGDLSTEDVHPTGDISTEDAHPTHDPSTEDGHHTGDPSTEDVHPTGDPSTEDGHPRGETENEESTANLDEATTPAQEGETVAEETTEQGDDSQPAAKEDTTMEEGKVEENTMTREITEDDVMAEPTGYLLPDLNPDTVDPNAFITVKVKLIPLDQVLTMASRLGQTIGKLKEYCAAQLKMQPSDIQLMFKKVLLTDSEILGRFGVGANGTIQLEMTSVDPETIPLKPLKHLSGLENFPDIISVNIPEESGETRTVTVEIELPYKSKPFLGGFRHKVNGTEFHNATAQTVSRPRAWPLFPKYSRSTQTAEVSNKVMQTTQDTSTQMTKIGCFVSVATDKLKAPGKYFTAQEKEDVILKKVIILQTYLRRYLAKLHVRKLMMKRDKRREFERAQCFQRKLEKEKRIKSEFERRMNPRAKEDFDTLYDALEKWRLEEIERIDSTLTGAERKAALYMLLNQETEHLAAIGRHKLEADTDNRENNTQKFLNKTAAPRVIKSNYDGLPTHIESPYTVRAKELRDIYNSLIMKHLTQDERLDILLTLKHTVNEHDCKLTHEILKLVDREADLLVRGISNENLEGLRKRIGTLFLQYIKTPKFNPGATKFIRVPPDPMQISGKIYFCTSCSSYLQSTEFPLNVNARNPGSCQYCKKKDNQARYRIDYSSYRHMLKVLRLDEEQRNDGSTVAFILQEADIRYLVEKIWGCESIISNSNDLYDLVLIRWDSEIPWSPWNCLLVTIEEAEKHGKLKCIYEDYGQVFFNKVKLKHQQARHYFSRLPGTAETLHKQQTNLIIDCTDNKNVSKQNSSTSQKSDEKN